MSNNEQHIKMLHDVRILVEVGKVLGRAVDVDIASIGYDWWSLFELPAPVQPPKQNVDDNTRAGYLRFLKVTLVTFATDTSR